MNLGKFLFSIKGRINRQPFWLFHISIIVLFILVGIILASIKGEDIYNIASACDALICLTIALIWPSFAVHVKRWHDRDKSGWWVLVTLIPIVGLVWALIELGFLRGTEGPNRFGPDPLLLDHSYSSE